MAKQLGNLYTKFVIHAMFTSGENIALVNGLHLGSYADKQYNQINCLVQVVKVRRKGAPGVYNAPVPVY